MDQIELVHQIGKIVYNPGSNLSPLTKSALLNLIAAYDKQRDEELVEGLAKWYWNWTTTTMSWNLLDDYEKAIETERARAAIKAARGQERGD